MRTGAEIGYGRQRDEGTLKRNQTPGEDLSERKSRETVRRGTPRGRLERRGGAPEAKEGAARRTEPLKERVTSREAGRLQVTARGYRPGAQPLKGS